MYYLYHVLSPRERLGPIVFKLNVITQSKTSIIGTMILYKTCDGHPEDLKLITTSCLFIVFDVSNSANT